MYTLNGTPSTLAGWIQDEITLRRTLKRGDKNTAVRRVQEWLTLAGFGLVMDGDFGPVTQRTVKRFQEAFALDSTGRVNKETYAKLVEPMTHALKQLPGVGPSMNDTVLACARQHLAQHPREVRGDNRGPWVRLYMSGREGPSQYWCAGFTRFIMRQAAELLQISLSVKGSVSCDRFAAQAKQAGLFLSEADARQAGVPPGSLFLVRRTSTDWTHIGIVTESEQTHFHTIEGNTNDDGERNGYEVCARARSYRKKDFILMAPIIAVP